MKKLLLLSLLLTNSFVLFAQQANFQGKIYANGQPVNATNKAIQFFIGPPLSWSTTVNVDVVNGLYSTTINFPANLFDDNNSSREMVVIYDAKPIDTVTIYAPLERDSIAKSYFRDSITWAHIHNKPTVDTSFTNEFQQLSINGDTIKITNGNAITLPSFDTVGTLTVNGKFKIIDTTLYQSFSNIGTYANTPGTTFWQSFKATESGKLRHIVLPIANNTTSCGTTVKVTLYQGQGTSTQALGTKTFTINSNTLSVITLDLSSGVNSSANGYIALTKGDVYTFLLEPQTGCGLRVGTDNTNPYPDGISSIGTTTDIAFAIYMDRSIPGNLSILSNGNVGIGIDTPTAALHVKGRIKDATGYLMPVGSVIAYAGATIPEGWLLCDGRYVSRTEYADLYAALGNAWGSGNSPTTFNLPDMRGQFLRGVDDSPTQGTSYSDQDRTIRQPIKSGGNSGNKVGSKQMDEYKSHTHKERPSSGNIWLFAHSTGGTWGNERNGNQLGPQTGASGGNETRPENVYVYYIIKY